MIPDIEEFAKILVEQVRDASIQSNDVALRSPPRSPVAKRWAKAAREENPFDFARVLIPDVVDRTVFYLLQGIDEGLIKISFTASNGRVVDLTTEGESELAGWYAGSDGWRDWYAKERFVDDLANLAGESPPASEG